MRAARITGGNAPMLRAIVASQEKLHQAWTEASSLGLDGAATALCESMESNARIIDTAFPGVFLNPMLCFEESVVIEEDPS